jgi:hypothetical protein
MGFRKKYKDFIRNTIIIFCVAFINLWLALVLSFARLVFARTLLFAPAHIDK